jgi:hypothetical protein
MKFIKMIWAKFTALKVWQKVVTVIVVLSIISALTGTTSSENNSSESVTTSESPSPEPKALTTVEKLSDSNVKWENYAETVKQRIADLIDAEDCTSLQAEFDIADQNSEATRNRTGESNANLMALIDDQMRKIGCFG